MTEPLTREQVELLRSLPPSNKEPACWKFYDDGHAVLWENDLIDMDSYGLGTERYIRRTEAGDTLLATIDTTREQVLREVENTARKADDACTGICVNFHSERDDHPDVWVPENYGPDDPVADTLVELLEQLAR